jgi:hypothetical protein
MQPTNPLAPKAPAKADVYAKLAEIEYALTLADQGSEKHRQLQEASKQLQAYLSSPLKEQEFKPQWDERKTRSIIEHSKKMPHAYNEDFKKNIKAHAEYHGVPYYEGEFNIGEALWQAVGGFVEGFTTLNFVDEPDNEYEAIVRNIAHLAGFAPGIMAGPAKMLGASKGLVGALNALNDKSVPMMAAKFATGKAKGLVKPLLAKSLNKKGAAGTTATNFLIGNRARHITEGAFHLGVASAVSSWQGGVDMMMQSFIGGAQAGAVFRGIGNMFKHDPKNGAKIVKGLAGSLFMGIPATMRGATTPEQVYEYLLGAYFGSKEVPWTTAKANKFTQKMRKHAQENPEYLFGMDPKAHPEWKNLPSEVKPIVKSLSAQYFGTPEERAAWSYHMSKLAGLEDQIVPMPIEKEGFQVTREVSKGEEQYKLTRSQLSKFKHWGISTGSGDGNVELSRILADRNTPSIHYVPPKGKKQTGMEGHSRPLTEIEVEAANTAIREANLTLEREISAKEQNRLRSYFMPVKRAGSAYLIGKFEPESNKQRISGHAGWIALDGIDGIILVKSLKKLKLLKHLLETLFIM